VGGGGDGSKEGAMPAGPQITKNERIQKSQLFSEEYSLKKKGLENVRARGTHAISDAKIKRLSPFRGKI